MKDLEEKQKIEVEYWRDSQLESPESNSVFNIINKVSEARVLADCLNRAKSEFAHDGKTLELGAGQGWASCIAKRIFPKLKSTVTDISEYAVESLPKWERIFEVEIENSYACKSYETQEQDESVDQVFSFAAAHHFLAHKRTLAEMSRILKPGGKVFYFYEPATPKFFYSLAYWRVNRNRPEVPEDVLITSELKRLAEENGFELRVDYYPSIACRGGFETMYYFMLSKLPVLQKFVPCTANFVFTKRK